ncbi:MAG TPA: type II toxin-antitoxin system RelE/ParE family toxin [Candidatus Acidoferrales bacterium]
MKPVRWVGSSLTELRSFPAEVQRDVGYAIYAAQKGERDPAAKPMKGFGGANVLEIVAPFDGDTFRAIYTVRLKDFIYVLHAFQKKSKSGKATPKKEIEMIQRRLAIAERDYEERRETDDREKKHK